MDREAEMMKQVDRLTDCEIERASTMMSSMYTDSRMPRRQRYRIAGARIFVDSRGAGARPKGMPMHSYFTPSHMNRIDLLSCWRRRK